MKKIRLTAGELRLWNEWKSKPDASLTHLNFQYRLDNAVDIKRLNLALSTAVSIFDAFRLHFIEEDGVPYRIVLPAKEVQVDFIDLTRDTLTDSTILEKVANQRRIELIKKPFDLRKTSLFRCALIKFSSESYYFVFVMPRILGDAYSLHLFLNLLSCVYNNGEEEKLKIMRQYQRRLREQSNDIQTKGIPEALEAESYWKTKFDTASCQVAFNTAKKLTAKQKNKRIEIRLPVKLIVKLKDLASARDTTLFTILAAAISIFLFRYFEQDDISLCYPANVRTGEYANQLFGFFVNELGLRVQLSGELSFYEVLTNIIQQRVLDRSYQHYPLIEMLLAKLSVDNPRLSFPFNVGIAPTYFLENRLVLQGVNVQPVNFFSPEHSLNDLLFLYEDISTDTQLKLVVDYNTATFNTHFIKQMISHLRRLLEGIVANPEERIDKIPLLNERERNQLLVTWNKTEKEYPTNKTIPEIFEAQVASSPDAIALRFEDESLSYREVNERANQLAHYLRSLGIGAETLVAICIERSFNMVIGLMGILKAGGAYVPLDPDYPCERLQFMLEDTQARVLLTQTHLRSQFSGWYTGHMIAIDDPALGLEEQPKDNLHQLTFPENLAYVIYTSGSTGKPKGVMIEQRGVINLVYSLIEKREISADDCLLQFARLIFDASVAEILVALLSGASLCLVSKTIKLIGGELVQVLKKNSISAAILTPSALETIPLETSLPSLRLLILAGEASSLVTVEKWSQRCQIINEYGPTETSVCATLGKVDLSRRKLSIGKPIANTKVYVLDQVQNPVPLGVIGELYIAGAGVARGYLRREELTKERFIENPFASEEDKREGKNLRLYRSGDLVRYLADGNIEYIGRMDHQVKLRGYRIELGEIEALLRAQEAIVREAVVIVREDSPGQKRLVAYLVLQDKSETKEAEHIQYLRQCIERQLPEYMVPGAFRVLERMPLTVTGKLDRRGLPVPDKHYRIEEYIAPRTKIEQALATIWSDLLGVEKIGVHDNFFSLGGHSLLVVQMLALVSKKVGRDFSISQFMGLPTIEMLSAQIENEAYGKKANHELIERLKKESVLDETIRPLSHMNPYLYNPKCVLLTGATGFLGAHVLYDLLEKTQATIYCLIRSSSIETALQNIMQKSLKYCLPIQKYADRIIPILGDLSKQKLGLSSHDFDILTKELDSIYHVGAWVHHLFDYDTLYKVNVQSTYEILRIATSTKNKAVHFISTLGTNYISPIVQLSSMDKDSEQVQLNFNGYLMSKWVSEQLLLEAATCRGIAAHVYRPGNIIAGVLHGISEPDSNHTLLRLKGLLQLKKGYIDRREMFEMIPVDLLATALINISRKPERFSYNLNNNKEVSWISYIMVAKAFGYHFDLIEDAQEWNHILDNLDKENALYKLTYFYKINVSNLQPEREQSQPIIPDYFISTPSYKEMMEKQLYSLIKSGFFPKPAK